MLGLTQYISFPFGLSQKIDSFLFLVYKKQLVERGSFRSSSPVFARVRAAYSPNAGAMGNEKMSTFLEKFRWSVEVARTKYRATTLGSEENYAALQHVHATYLEWAPKAPTVEDAKEVYLDCIRGTEAARIAHRRWVELCTCAREAADTYEYARPEQDEAGEKNWLSYFPLAEDIYDPVLRFITKIQVSAYWADKYSKNTA